MIFNIKSLGKSFVFATKGLFKVFKEEQNLRLQLFLALIMFFVGTFLGINITEWMFLLTAVFMVLILEVVNSALERLSDMLKPRINTYVREIKDIMAAAVVLASIFAVLIGVLIFGKHFIEFIYVVGGLWK